MGHASACPRKRRPHQLGRGVFSLIFHFAYNIGSRLAKKTAVENHCHLLPRIRTVTVKQSIKDKATSPKPRAVDDRHSPEPRPDFLESFIKTWVIRPWIEFLGALLLVLIIFFILLARI